VHAADIPLVLIVDDQPRNLDVLETMLLPLGCELVRSTSADEALLALLRHDFAAIVLDIRMPGMNGIDLAKLIKQRKRSRHVPILFLTAHSADETDVLQGYGVGAVDYLSKPINADILRSKVGVFIDLFTKTRALEALNEQLHSEIGRRQDAQAALERANQELERRVAQRTAALSHARDEAERQSRLKDEFVASLSHELRTPMNVILGWLSMLDEGKPIKDVYATLAIVKRNAELQAKLIDDLLDINRLMSGSVQLEMTSVDVSALLTQTIQGLKPAADSKGVTILASLDSPAATLLGDARRLQQVFWNVVHNAVKFTPRGGRVEIRARRNEGQLEISVQDSGRGISPSFLPHVFDRFRQEVSALSGGTAGLGIGLSIARQLVELHGGQITAFSGGPGAGATFVVSIPIATNARLSSAAGTATAE
jgi:signal transduction histidine kinase